MITDVRLGHACDGAVWTKRRTLAYRAAKPWSSTRSCQIAIALRPRSSASPISSRYGSHALALGARPGRGAAARSVDTSAWWPVLADPSRWTPRRKWPVLTAGVGGHLRRGGRFWRPDPRASAPAAHGNAGRFQILAGRLPPDAGRLFDAPQRPAQSPQRHDLLLSCSSKTLLMAARSHGLRAAVNVSVATRGGRFSGVHRWPVLGVHRGPEGT